MKTILLSTAIFFLVSTCFFSCKPKNKSGTDSSRTLNLPDVGELKDKPSNNSNTSWTADDKKSFISNCMFEEARHTELTSLQLTNACNCMADKASVKFATVKEAGHMREKEAELLFSECLPSHGSLSNQPEPGTSEENGIIYIKHPYIDVVNKSVQAYRDKDIATNSKIFADTAKFWISGWAKQIPIAAALKDWATDFDFYNDIKVTPVGYPDYLHYKDKDQKYVQSWWQWTGKSKKTGALVTIDFIQLDKFNSAGKIEFESIYGDFSKMVKN